VVVPLHGTDPDSPPPEMEQFVAPVVWIVSVDGCPGAVTVVGDALTVTVGAGGVGGCETLPPPPPPHPGANSKSAKTPLPGMHFQLLIRIEIPPCPLSGGCPLLGRTLHPSVRAVNKILLLIECGHMRCLPRALLDSIHGRHTAQIRPGSQKETRTAGRFSGRIRGFVWPPPHLHGRHRARREKYLAGQHRENSPGSQDHRVGIVPGSLEGFTFPSCLPGYPAYLSGFHPLANLMLWRHPNPTTAPLSLPRRISAIADGDSASNPPTAGRISTSGEQTDSFRMDTGHTKGRHRQ
jgi:hypothetical protein